MVKFFVKPERHIRKKPTEKSQTDKKNSKDTDISEYENTSNRANSLTNILFGKINRICFRSDKRHPDYILQAGFNPRPTISQELLTLIESGFARESKNREDIFTEMKLSMQKRHAQKGEGWASPEIIKSFKKTSIFYIDNWFRSIIHGVHHNDIKVVDSELEINEAMNSSFAFGSNNLVAVSSRVRAATLFPGNSQNKMDETQQATWLYAISIENGFDIHMYAIVVELLGYKQNDNTKSTSIPLEMAMKMYADEIITTDIPPEQIICAVKIEKTQSLDENGLIKDTYQLKEIIDNPDCMLSQQKQKHVLQFVKNEMALNHCTWNQLDDDADKTMPSSSLK